MDLSVANSVAMISRASDTSVLISEVLRCFGQYLDGTQRLVDICN